MRFDRKHDGSHSRDTVTAGTTGLLQVAGATEVKYKSMPAAKQTQGVGGASEQNWDSALLLEKYPSVIIIKLFNFIELFCILNSSSSSCKDRIHFQSFDLPTFTSFENSWVLHL